MGVKNSQAEPLIPRKKRQLWFNQLILGQILNIMNLIWVSRDCLGK